MIHINKTLRKKGIRKAALPAKVKVPPLNITGTMVKTGKVPKFKVPKAYKY